MTASSNSFQSTRPVGRVLWEELLVFSRFHSYLQAASGIFVPCINPIIYMLYFLITFCYFSIVTS